MSKARRVCRDLAPSPVQIGPGLPLGNADTFGSAPQESSCRMVTSLATRAELLVAERCASQT